MGRGPAGDFARKIVDVIRDLTLLSGGQIDGRWIAGETTKSKDYWNRAFAHDYPLNVNDVAEAAKIFRVSPYEIAVWARDGIPAERRTEVATRAVVRGVSEPVQITSTSPSNERIHVPEERDAALRRAQIQEEQEGSTE